MLYKPPSCTKVSFAQVVKHCFSIINDNEFNKIILQRTTGLGLITAISWVGILAFLLKKLSDKMGKNEIILAKYSCFEFTMAVKIAKLKCRYVDVDKNFKMSVEQTVEAISEKTLAVLVNNNAGIFSEMDEFRRICNERGVIFLEDATYTLGGDYKGKPAGSIGDFSILNFSEGKAIPIGGGGIILNNKEFMDFFVELNEYLKTKNIYSRKNSYKSLVMYKLGTNFSVYTLYQIFKNISGINVKEKVSMEKIRNINYNQYNTGEGRWEESVQVELESLLEQHHPVQKQLGTLFWNVFEKSIPKRYQHAQYYKEELKSLPGIKTFPFKKNQAILRYPVLITRDVKFDYHTEQKLGISHLYHFDSELYHPQMKETNSKLFYEKLITLPVYPELTIRDLAKVVKYVKSLVSQ